MTPGGGQQPPNFKDLIPLGKLKGINVVLIDSSYGTGLSEENSTKAGMFKQALKDPNAIGVIFVGHGGGDQRVRPFNAFQIGFGGEDRLNQADFPTASEIKSSLLGVFACGVKDFIKIPGLSAGVMTLDGGEDGLTSLAAIGHVGYAAAKAVINGEDINRAISSSNKALSTVQSWNLKDVETKTRLVDKGDRVIRANVEW